MSNGDIVRAQWHICEQCGKQFFTGTVSDWAYKKKSSRHKNGVKWSDMSWFCSWSCMSKWHKEREKPKDDEEPLY